jgi:hypothetical protein
MWRIGSFTPAAAPIEQGVHLRLTREHLLPGLLTLLVLAGALMLGLGQVDRSPMLAALCLAPLSFLLCDVWKVFRMHRLIANLLAIVVVVWTMREFFQQETAGQLFSIARMLVFLQLVLLFQEKNHRLEWQILVLSLLDIVVAAALNLGFYFGLLLGAYLLLSVAVIVLIYWEDELQTPPARRMTASRKGSPWQSLISPLRAVAPSETEMRRHMPGVGQTLLRATGILIPAVLFAVAFFVSVPRVRANAWLGGGKAGGFAGATESMVMRDRGWILSSERPVMRVSLLSGLYRMPFTVQDELYLLGGIMNRYTHDHLGSRWMRPDTTLRSKAQRRRTIDVPTRHPMPNEAVVEITLEPTTSTSLFAVTPVVRIPETPHEVYFHRVQGRLLRGRVDEEISPAEYHYQIATPAFHKMRQLRASPHLVSVQTPEDAQALRQELTAWSEFDSERFPRLKAIADEVCAGLDPVYSSSLSKGLALQGLLQHSGIYRYTKDLNFHRTPGVDPIEDFVANHHRGHCEYFAGALVLMLRSQDIPARLVVGYKGGEFNPLGHYYLIREKHAHAWVEMYLPPEEVPPSEWAGPTSLAGAWFRLDPTPQDTEQVVVANQNGAFLRVNQAIDYADVIWREYVVGMSVHRQQEVGYDPFLFGADFAPEFAFAYLARGSNSPHPDPSKGLLRRQNQAFAAGLLILACAVVVGAIGWRLLALWRRRRQHALVAKPKGCSIDFYSRLLALLSQRGVGHRASQTSGELQTAALAAWLPVADKAPAVPSALGAIVAGYRRARFGGKSLDPQETDVIEKSLRDIESWQAAPRGK